jgi:P4 family phage/plasmid primase-like protien
MTQTSLPSTVTQLLMPIDLTIFPEPTHFQTLCANLMDQYKKLSADCKGKVTGLDRVSLFLELFGQYILMVSDGQELYLWNAIYYKPYTKQQFNQILEYILKQTKIKASNLEIHDIYDRLRSIALQSDLNPEDLVMFQNGIFDCSSLQLEPISSVRHFTYCVMYDYSPQIDCPEFKTFLVKALPNESDRILLLTYFAYCFTAGIDQQLALFLVGRGANGKSTLAEILQDLLSTQCTIGTFDQLVDSDRPFTKTRLRNKTCCICSEIESEDATNKKINTFKRIITNSTLDIEKKFNDAIVVANKVKYLIDANKLPKVGASDPYAFYRRIRVLEFRYRIPKNDRIVGFAKKILAKEGGSIAAYILSFIPQIKDILVENPKETQNMWENWLDETRYFVQTKLVTSDYGTCKATEIYDVYTTYMSMEGLTPQSQTAFFKILKQWHEGVRCNNGIMYNVDRKKLFEFHEYCKDQIYLLDMEADLKEIHAIPIEKTHKDSVDDYPDVDLNTI